MNTLLGSQPQAKFSTQPTGQPGQTASIDPLIALLSQAFTSNANAAAPVAGEAQGALPAQLGYQAPQETAPIVNAGQAFQTGVVDPVTQDFLQRTLPGIAGEFGRGAGGAFGSGSAQAREQAGVDTTRALAQEGSKFQLSTDIANQQAQVSTNTANQTATNQAAQIRNAALGLAPGTAGIMGTATQPTLQDLLTAILSPTETTLGVGTGGSTGLIQGLLAGPLGSAGGTVGGLALASALGFI